MITFSIVTITYNAASVLQRTLDSVFMQDYEHIEHLIIDGASKDDTVSMAEAYKKKVAVADDQRRVTIVSEPDNGLYDAMNKGLRMATGDYVLFLNAGDRLPSADTLSAVALVAEPGDGEEMPAVVYGNTDIVDIGGHFIRHRRLQPPEKLTWRSFKWGMLVCHQAFYARTDIAKMFPYDTRFRHSADVDWCIKVMKEGERRGLALRPVHRVVALFLQGGDTMANHNDSLQERFQVMRRHYGLLQTVLLHGWFLLRSFYKK